MDKKIPMRKCVGCGESKDKRELVRVVKQPDGTFLTDITGKANGRGAYICKKSECLKKALKNKGFERAFQAKLPPDVTDSLTKEFENFE